MVATNIINIVAFGGCAAAAYVSGFAVIDVQEYKASCRLRRTIQVAIRLLLLHADLSANSPEYASPAIHRNMSMWQKILEFWMNICAQNILIPFASEDLESALSIYPRSIHFYTLTLKAFSLTVINFGL